MKIAYISPSSLPSRSANSIHVLNQCEALAVHGAEVTLFASRSTKKEALLQSQIHRIYGINTSSFELKTIFPFGRRGKNFLLGSYASAYILLLNRFNVIISRNIFSSFFLSFLSSRMIIVEVHQVETGVRGLLQRLACRRKNVRIITISNALQKDLKVHVGKNTRPTHVLHDAAPDRTEHPSLEKRQQWRNELLKDDNERQRFICAYIGHLYEGRGIEIIESVAQALPEILFLVIGGNDTEILKRQRANEQKNVKYLGYMPHPLAQRAMSAVDLLLMPYQEKVSIGVGELNTGRWMSPMKMFEYMASGTAFIASDLPILREVLRHNHNSLLVEPSHLKAWEDAILHLQASPGLRANLALNAYFDYKANYTWSRRAERILEILHHA